MLYSETYQIRAFETDRQGQASPSALANLLQEIAGNHASSRDLGFEHMQEQGAFWVLNRLEVRIHRFPVWREPLRVETWVRDMRGPFSHRDFEIFDERGAVVLSAATLWVLLDQESRRPRRGLIAPETIPLIPERLALSTNPAKVGALAEGREVTRYRARYSEIDMVGHVNNVRYLDWILDSYPLSFRDGHQLLGFTINFLSETHLGEEVVLRQQIEHDPDLHNFSLFRVEAEREACRACLKWKPIS
jgi:medium-chain acyl-[acyl-carrier-protein] hydrolase